MSAYAVQVGPESHFKKKLHSYDESLNTSQVLEYH